ncbi:hypothetical protein ABK040_016679 [Willaertia magna]
MSKANHSKDAAIDKTDSNIDKKNHEEVKQQLDQIINHINNHCKNKNHNEIKTNITSFLSTIKSIIDKDKQNPCAEKLLDLLSELFESSFEKLIDNDKNNNISSENDKKIFVNFRNLIFCWFTSFTFRKMLIDTLNFYINITKQQGTKRSENGEELNLNFELNNDLDELSKLYKENSSSEILISFLNDLTNLNNNLSLNNLITEEDIFVNFWKHLLIVLEISFGKKFLKINEKIIKKFKQDNEFWKKSILLLQKKEKLSSICNLRKKEYSQLLVDCKVFLEELSSNEIQNNLLLNCEKLFNLLWDGKYLKMDKTLSEFIFEALKSQIPKEITVEEGIILKFENTKIVMDGKLSLQLLNENNILSFTMDNLKIDVKGLGIKKGLSINLKGQLEVSLTVNCKVNFNSENLLEYDNFDLKIIKLEVGIDSFLASFGFNGIVNIFVDKIRKFIEDEVKNTLQNELPTSIKEINKSINSVGHVLECFIVKMKMD